jgi:hypothetical protein
VRSLRQAGRATDARPQSCFSYYAATRSPTSPGIYNFHLKLDARPRTNFFNKEKALRAIFAIFVTASRLLAMASVLEQLMAFDQAVARIGPHAHNGMTDNHVTPAQQSEPVASGGEVPPGPGVDDGC